MKILIRNCLAEDEEFGIASMYFDVVEHRSDCYDELVVPRYSLLPYPEELHYDLDHQFCKTINSLTQHLQIANFTWYQWIKDYTPRTWTGEEFGATKPSGPFIVKGATNSKKWQWDTHMYAETFEDAVSIAHELHNDMYLCDQNVVFRSFVPLEVFEIGLHGLPFSNEYRIFCYKTNLICNGYYWSIAENINHHITNDGIAFAQHIANILGKHLNFYVIDVAKTKSGDWIVIEVNDGCMSGLSECSCKELYAELYRLLKTEC